jgi:trk system potassium uptake protein TrkH
MNDKFKINVNSNRKKKRSPSQVLVFGFILVILAGGLLLSLPISNSNHIALPFLNALFTSASAVCVTGLTVVDIGSVFSVFGQIVIMLLMQIGGLGFMTFASFFAILLGRKITLKERMILQESYNQSSIEGIVKLAKNIFLFAFLVEGIAVILLALRWSYFMKFGKALYYALFHTVSAFNNAGFGLFENSLTGFRNDIITNIIIIVLIIMGGIGFSVISEIYYKRGKNISLHSWLVIKMTGILILAGTILFFVLEYNNPGTLGNLNTQEKILSSLFQSVTPRTAGFNTVDILSLKDTTKLFLIVLMFIGASPGSTGGGIKTTTFIAILISIFCTIKHKCQFTIRNRAISREITEKAVVISALAIMWIILITGLLTLTETADFLTLLFETVSAFSTVGLSLGITSSLSDIGKILLIVTMFIGRVGFLTLAFAIGRGQKTSNQAKYPESKIMVG